QRQAVRRGGPEPGPRLHRCVAVRSPAVEVGTRRGDQPFAGTGRRLCLPCAELEHTRDSDAAGEGTEAELRLGKVERVPRRVAAPGERDTVSARADERNAHAEP